MHCGKQDVGASKKKVSALTVTISMTLLTYNIALSGDTFQSIVSLWRGVITANYIFRLDTKLKIIQPDVCLTLRVTSNQFSLFGFNQKAVRKAVVRFELPRSYLSTMTSVPRHVIFFWKLLWVMKLFRIFDFIQSVSTGALTPPLVFHSHLCAFLTDRTVWNMCKWQTHLFKASFNLPCKIQHFVSQYSWVLEKILNWNCLTVLGSSVGMFLHIYGMLPDVYN